MAPVAHTHRINTLFMCRAGDLMPTVEDVPDLGAFLGYVLLADNPLAIRIRSWVFCPRGGARRMMRFRRLKESMSISVGREMCKQRRLERWEKYGMARHYYSISLIVPRVRWRNLDKSPQADS